MQGGTGGSRVPRHSLRGCCARPLDFRMAGGILEILLRVRSLSGPYNRFFAEMHDGGLSQFGPLPSRSTTCDAPMAAPTTGYEVITVLGPIAPEQMGITQTHEHLFIDAVDHYADGKGFGHLLETFVPMLRQRDVSDEAIQHMLVTNLARAFARRQPNG